MLQRLTLLGWPAVETQEVAGWTVRFSSGVTRRANSVVSTAMPRAVEEVEAGVDEVERRSAERWLVPSFQLWQSGTGTWLTDYAEDPADEDFFEGQQRLADVLEARGYSAVAPTRVLWLDAADTPDIARWDPRVRVQETLTEEWLDAFAADTGDVTDRLVHRQLLGGGRSRFYLIRDEEQAVAGVVKVSLVTCADSEGGPERTHAGIYALWIRPDLRGDGLGSALVESVFDDLRRIDVAGYWLQVEERSTRALATYGSLGFRTVARYRYLVGTAA